jgi:selT/selW/selH-like putative selenoprotein
MSFKVSIQYCSICQYSHQVSSLIAEILSLYERKIESLTIQPSNKIGDLEVTLNGELFFSKQRSGRLPNPGEVEQLLGSRILGGK